MGNTGIYKRFSKLKKKFRKILSKGYKFYTLRILYPGIYKKFSKKPVDDYKVVFIEVRMPEISDNFSLIYDRVKRDSCYKVSTHFLRMSFAKRKEYRNLCKAMVKDIATAKYVFMNESSNVTSCLSMRKETILTQLCHGCGAFKKFGMSTAELKFGDNKATLEKYPYHRNYTHVTVSSPEVIWAYEEAMSLKNEKGVVKATGVSRTDVFFDKEFISSAKDRVYRVFPQARNKKVILYAPTFRGRVAKAKTPDVLDVEQLFDAFGDEYVIIFKHHPFVKRRPVILDKYKEFAKDLTDMSTIEDLIIVSDICISDYSSLVFEYSLFVRPMIFLAHDLEDYFDWRGFYYDYKDFVPGPIVTTTSEIVDYISDIDNTFDRERVIEFREKYMSACDGHATDRIMKLVFEGRS